mgnify:CR=1 FL=1
MEGALSEKTRATFDAIASIFLRCFLLTVGAMIFTWIAWLMLGEVIYSIHSQMYEITRREFDLYFLYTMTGLKTLNILFFGVPFIAIKMYLWKIR